MMILTPFLLAHTHTHTHTHTCALSRHRQALSAPRIVRCGEFGHATIIKIFSNILCAAHDVAVGETLCVAKKAGLDMQLVFDAMRVSSGNSFCWETEVLFGGAESGLEH